MSTSHRDLLNDIRTFPSLVKYLRDELDWPIESDNFEELTFEYTPEELGIDSKNAAKIQEIKRLRPLSVNQPWGIFFVKFEPKRLPIVALRRILSRVVVKKRASANSAERTSWEMSDLLFISNYGEGEERRISLAHFSQDTTKNDLPTLKVLGWDNLDTALHLDYVADEFQAKLTWPEDESDVDSWRETWCSAFILRPKEVITTSKALAVRLAELARAIRDRIGTVLAIETEDGPVTKLMKAFQESLIHDLDEDSFADMYAQTIAYGLLSARITNPKGDTADDFANQLPVTNPFLKELMETFLDAGGRKGKAGSGMGIDFDELGVSDVVELLDDAKMEDVVRDFGDRNPQEDPIIHFYELFLKEYDAKKRMQRGVFYTPRPVVSFIVRSVDEILRTEFGMEDGLADTATWGEMAKRHKDLEIPESIKPEDPFVQILDPATGTGTFLVEAIDLIYKTMTAKWQRQGHNPLFEIPELWNEYVPKHLLPRLHGYELLMAPYAIAHMKIGLKLYETGYRFGSGARARVYLTNALEPAKPFQMSFDIPALAHEAAAVNAIKQDQRFTVVIGNPPYSGVSANRSREDDGSLTFIGLLIEDYRQIDGRPLGERNPKMLQDDYVKFIRFAQWNIDRSGMGILGYITNHAYLDNPTFRGMRQALMNTFSEINVYNLHGNSRRGERPPNGTTDKNVFDIQQGVSIFLGEKGISPCYPMILYSDMWGLREKKYASLNTMSLDNCSWSRLEPLPAFYLFVPQDITLLDEYSCGVQVRDIFPLNSVGIDTGRDGLTIQWTIRDIERIIKEFVSLSPESARAKYQLSDDTVEWKVEWAQRDLKQSKVTMENTHQILYRPFDIRYTYYTGKTKGFHCRPRAAVMRQMLKGGNLSLITVRQQSQDGMPWTLVGITNMIAERCAISNKTKEANYYFPLYLMQSEDPDQTTFYPVGSERPNISPAFLELLAEKLHLEQTKPTGLPRNITPQDILNYAYSVFHSPAYRSRYSEFLKIDFPRLPLTSILELFRTLVELGGGLVALHLMESPKLDKHITTLVGSGMFRVEKVSYSDETVWINKAKTRGFRGVPEDVWNFHIGGYQVCNKWLKDRQAKGGKKPRHGRILTDEDINHYQKIVVALNETICIMKEIDEVIDQHGGWPGAFVTQAAEKVSEAYSTVAAEGRHDYGKKRGSFSPPLLTRKDTKAG